MGRLISLAVAAGYLLLAYLSGGISLTLKILLYLIVGLACIWFGDELGTLTGFTPTRMINISDKTSGSFVSFIGWLMLILVPGIVCAIGGAW